MQPVAVQDRTHLIRARSKGLERCLNRFLQSLLGGWRKPMLLLGPTSHGVFTDRC